MKRSVLLRGLWLCVLVPLLKACTAVPVKTPDSTSHAAYLERTAVLRDSVEWGMTGKVSLDDGDQGGSGRLQWDVRPGRSELDFHGAMGRGAWHLQIGPEGALLKMADGTEQAAAGVGELIQEHMGWHVPLEALQWWVRGLAAPGMVESEQVGPGGLLISLQQFGWEVDFTRYDSVGVVELPVRLTATRDQYRVKLAISRWQMDVSDDTAN